jgi:hypothetical protein
MRNEGWVAEQLGDGGHEALALLLGQGHLGGRGVTVLPHDP